MPMFNSVLPGGIGKAGREEKKKNGETMRNPEIICTFSGGSFKLLWEWSWPSLGRGHHLVAFLDPPLGRATAWRAFLEVELGLRQLPGEEAWNEVSAQYAKDRCQGLEWDPWLITFPDSLYKGVLGSRGDALTKQYLYIYIYSDN